MSRAKFTPPRLRPETVTRRHLVDQIVHAGTPLVVVSGPAGSGKSTLLAQAQLNDRQAVWLSCDATDNDPVVFWWALIESLGGVSPDFGATYRHRLVTAGSAVVDDVVASVVNEIGALDRPITIYADDLHAITDVATRRSLHRFIGQLPGNACFVAACRDAPPIPLGRFRVEGSLVELTGADLALSADETNAVLTGLGSELVPEQLATVMDKTEGWAAGVQLAGMALEGSSDLAGAIADFEGSDRLVADYFVSEVLDRLDPADQAFLVETSILHQLSGEVCDSVTGRSGGAERLRELEDSNAFLIPLDRTQTNYRYHHLFAELLLDRLSHRPDSDLTVLHERAFRWYRDRDDVVNAVRHGLAAGLQSPVADLACIHWFPLTVTGRAHTAQHLIEQFDEAEIRGYQPLAVATAFLLGMGGDARGARTFLDAAEELTHDGPPPDGSASMKSSLALARGSLALDGVDQALTDGRLAFDLEPPHSPWRSVAALIVGIAHQMRGEFAEAAEYLEAALEADDDAVVAYALAELAICRLASGDGAGALALAERSCEITQRIGTEDLVPAGTGFGALGHALLVTGSRAAAAVALVNADRPMRFVDQAMPMDALNALVLLGELALEVSDYPRARSYLDRAARIAAAGPDTGVVGAQIERLQAEFRRRQTDQIETVEREESFTARELEVLALFPTELTTREIGEELFLSRNTVKTYTRRVYRKLSVSSREEAVEKARVSGILV